MSAPTICYVVNQYPKISHSFIRREIAALERMGVDVRRVSVRGWQLELVEEADRLEREKTFYILREGAVRLLLAAAAMAVSRPKRFWEGLRLAVRTGRSSRRGVVIHLIYLLEACRLAQFAEAARVSHMHAHFGTNSTDVAMLAHVLTGTPYSFTVHGPDEFDEPRAINLGEKIRRSAFAVAISSYGIGQLARWSAPGDDSRLAVVRCGIDDAFLSPSENAPAQEPGRFVCVGRLCNEKGQMMLVRAAARLAAEGRSFSVVLVGDGDIRSEIEAEIDRLGLRDVVSLRGWADTATVRRELQMAQVFILPSVAEGLPVVIMEALALSRPVLTTYIAGIPELIRNGEEGWLFPSGSVDEIAAAMRRALDASPEDLRRMGSSGRARVLALHDINQEAAKLLELIDFERSTAA